LLEDDLTGSLYEIFRRRFGIYPTRALQQLSAGLSDRRESNLLDIKLSSPVLRLSRLTIDQSGQPFEVVESIYRGDKYIFDAELIATSQPAHV
jgi:GntR family transcriptional regulator